MNERTFDDLIADSFRKDPTYALELLNDILADGEPGELLIALRQMNKAFGGMDNAIRQVPLNGIMPDRTLAAEDNPRDGPAAGRTAASGRRVKSHHTKRNQYFVAGELW